MFRDRQTHLQLLHPVLTFGLLVLARLCLGGSLVIGTDDEVEEDEVRWLAASGAMTK